MNYTVDELINRYPELKVCRQSIIDAYNILEKCYEDGNKLLIAGNGGSCADSEHIVGELMKGFKSPRKLDDSIQKALKEVDSSCGEELANKLQGALPAIALVDHQALNTAFINDVENGGNLAFAQQIMGYGNKGDVFLAITTSGNSKGIYNACVVAKAKGLKIIGLTGKDGGKLKTIADVSIIAPSNETFMIQELHLPIYHCLCLLLENKFFK